MHYSKLVEDLKTENEGLKKDKSKLTNGLIQLKKIADDLKRKNTSKTEALIAIKSFFMNETLIKLNKINEFSEENKVNNKD